MKLKHFPYRDNAGDPFQKIRRFVLTLVYKGGQTKAKIRKKKYRIFDALNTKFKFFLPARPRCPSPHSCRTPRVVTRLTEGQTLTVEYEDGADVSTLHLDFWLGTCPRSDESSRPGLPHSMSHKFLSVSTRIALY